MNPRRVLVLMLAGAAFVAGTATASEPLIKQSDIQGDALVSPVSAVAGDATRGRDIFVDREGGHCVLCHAVSTLDAEFQGNVGPALDGVGSRYDEFQLRLRVADIRRIRPDTVMPSYYRVTGLNQVGDAWQGKPVLTGQEIEDIVAYLLSLKE